VNTEGEKAKEVASFYAITTLPTFIIFRDGKVVDKVKSADPNKLKHIIETLSNEIETAGSTAAGSSSGSSGGIPWVGADLPRGYSDISDIIDIRGLELLNADSEFSARTLFSKPKPTALAQGNSDSKDWVESDTDEQLLLYLPFNSAVKLHTIQVYHQL
jgi:hypothetical protein